MCTQSGPSLFRGYSENAFQEEKDGGCGRVLVIFPFLVEGMCGAFFFFLYTSLRERDTKPKPIHLLPPPPPLPPWKTPPQPPPPPSTKSPQEALTRSRVVSGEINVMIPPGADIFNAVSFPLFLFGPARCGRVSSSTLFLSIRGK